MNKITAVIFDLDGVIVSTDNCHYLSWKQMADNNNIVFDETIGERLRGVSRMESLNIILENSKVKCTEKNKIALAAEKNLYFLEFVAQLTNNDILPGVINILKKLKQNKIKMAIGSSSKNATLIINQLKISSYFNVIVDGNDIKKSKPNPEVFLLASKKLNVSVEHCLVIEDAIAGVDAAINANMKVLGINSAMKNSNADFRMKNLVNIDIMTLL